MKKRVSLFLFAIACASALNGMQNQNFEPIAYKVPEEVCGEIVTYLSTYIPTYDSLEEIVYTIESASLIDTLFNKKVQEIYGDQKKFTELVVLLGKKFNKSTVAIATAFTTPTSKHYIDLVNQLKSAFSWRNSSNIPPHNQARR